MNKSIVSKVKRLFKTVSSNQQKEAFTLSINSKKEQPTIKLNTTKSILLQKNLKHLEFINFLETRYSEKALNQFSIEVLQSFQNIKIQAQNNTLSLLQSKSYNYNNRENPFVYTNLPLTYT